MRAAALVLFSVLLPAAAQQKTAAPIAAQVRPIPDEAVRQNGKLAANLSPSARAKLRSAAAALAVTAKQQPAMTATQMQSKARNLVVRAFPNLQGMDIDAVVFMVMMQCAQDQESDLQQVMRQTQQNSLAKQATRAEGQATSASQANSVSQLSDVSETQSLELQMLMDQRSKLLQAISNVMKSGSDTQASVIANLK
jgi:hypothetical protein